MSKKKTFSLYGMPIEIREDVPNNELWFINKGKANWFKKTDGSEVIYTIKKPQVIKHKSAPKKPNKESK